MPALPSPLLPLLLGLVLAGCNSGGDPPPASASYDLVFDSKDMEGVLRLYLWREGATTAEPFGRGDAGAFPDARKDGRAVLLQSNPDINQPSGLMLVSDFNQPAVLLSGRTGAGERQPRWSPDGHRIVFSGQRDDGAGDIFVADIAGYTLSNIKNLTPCPGCAEGSVAEVTPTWSPDGQHIAYASDAGGELAIWVMDADGGNAHPVTPVDDIISGWGFHSPTWSPDGRRIACQRSADTGTHVYIINLADHALRRVDLPGQAAYPAWSPDGNRLAVSLKVDAEWDIAVVTPEGQLLARLPHPGRDLHPTWLKR